MPQVQNAKQFFDDFIETAAHAKKRIYLQSIFFEAGKILEQIETVVVKKAQEGVDVHVIIDWVSERYVEDNPHILPTLKKSVKTKKDLVHRQTKLLINRWKQAGVTFTTTNSQSGISLFLSIYGRNHKKIYLVDDTAVWLGSANLLDRTAQSVEIMAKFTNPAMIQAVSEEFFKVNNNRPAKNYSVMVSPLYELLVDAGTRGKSIIYDTATEAVTAAKESIIFASPFVPDGKILREIIAASRRGVPVTIITSNIDHKNFTLFPYNIPYKLMLEKIKHEKNISVLYQDRKVHAKILLIDQKSVLFGSHNFVDIGVQLATEEIAVKTTDPHLIGSITAFLKENTTWNQ